MKQNYIPQFEIHLPKADKIPIQTYILTMSCGSYCETGCS